MSSLLDRVKAGADASQAEVRARRFLDAAAERGIKVDDQAVASLALLFGQSDYLSSLLVAHPQWGNELTAVSPRKSIDQIGGELRAHAKAHSHVAALRDVRNRAFVRLGLREFSGAPLGEIGGELSDLASACLDFAIECELAACVERYGEPLTDTGARCRFVVLGFGKLGGSELNFLSDIDLAYFYESDEGRAGDLSLHEFFSRLGERVTQAIGGVEEQGFCFRVDLRLRPEGSRGPLCNSLLSAERYYESFGRLWERQALIKARPVAGDVSLGDELLQLLSPFVWPRSTAADAVDKVRELLGRARQQLRGRDDLKLGRGGIREIEFFVQALQLIHGGKQPALRQRNTLVALDRLLYAGLVSERERQELSSAYLFLRQVEHRLQLDEGQQTHSVPAIRSEKRKVLAARLGFPSEKEFKKTLDDHRKKVSARFDTLGAEQPTVRPEISRLCEPGLLPNELAAALSALGFGDGEAAAEELVRLYERPHSPFWRGGESRELATRLLSEVVESPDPDLALRRLVDLVARGGAAAGLFRLLAEHAPLLRRVVSLFGTSEFLAKLFIAHPELVEPLLSGRSDQRPQLAGEDEEEALNLLRRFKSEQILRVAIADIGGVLSPSEVAGQLSQVAETVLGETLALVQKRLAAQVSDPIAPLAVLGLGRLGAGELGYLSDLDLVFVYRDDPQKPDAARQRQFEIMSRLCARLVHALSAYLDEGRLYEIDTRLRPSGQQGTLVSSWSSFVAYHDRAAQLWERQALIKARAVAGDAALGQELETLISTHVYRRVDEDERSQIAIEMAGMRKRMESERSRVDDNYFDVKQGAGGLIDIEFLVEYLQLCFGHTAPELRVRGCERALLALAKTDLFPSEEVADLLSGYRFLRRLENWLRLVNDRPISLLPKSGRELDKVARRMGYHDAAPGLRLLQDFRETSARVRSIYNRIFS